MFKKWASNSKFKGLDFKKIQNKIILYQEIENGVKNHKFILKINFDF